MFVACSARSKMDPVGVDTSYTNNVSVSLKGVVDERRIDHSGLVEVSTVATHDKKSRGMMGTQSYLTRMSQTLCNTYM